MTSFDTDKTGRSVRCYTWLVGVMVLAVPSCSANTVPCPTQPEATASAAPPSMAYLTARLDSVVVETHPFKGTLRAIRTDGTEGWRTTLSHDELPLHRPVVAPNSNLLVRGQKHLRSIDVDGRTRWVYPVSPMSPNMALGAPSPTLGSGAIVYIDGEGVVALDPRGIKMDALPLPSVPEDIAVAASGLVVIRSENLLLAWLPLKGVQWRHDEPVSQTAQTSAPPRQKPR